MKLTAAEWLKKYVTKTLTPEDTSPMDYPPAIAKTLGFDLAALSENSVTMEMETCPARHGNPMGTIHGGVIADLADSAIGTLHSLTLKQSESFTTVDLRLNYFRPIWKEKIQATAKPVHIGKTISFYTCDVTKADGKLVATVSSSVMTLRGDQTTGR